MNGARRTVSWGSTLADFSGNHRRVDLFRHYQNELAPVEVDTRDHEALRVPLCLETLSNGGNEGGLSMRFEHWWYSVPLRVRWFLRRNRVEQELDEEFRFHLDHLIAQELAAGKPADEAKRAALRAMDGMERQKERCRDMRRVPYIETLVHDFHHGLRALRRKPTFMAGVIAILALGIGASTAVFSVVDAVLLRPLPYTSADRLVKIEEGSSKREMKAMFGADFLRLRARIDLFDNAVAYVRDDVTVTGINTMLGTRARLGRALVETDDDPNDLHSRRRDATGF